MTKIESHSIIKRRKYKIGKYRHKQHPQLPCTLSSSAAWWTEEQDLASEEGVAPLMPRPQALTADQQVPAEPT